MGVTRILDSLATHVFDPISANSAIDADDVGLDLLVMQERGEVKISSVEVTPIIQYNGMEGFPRCPPGPGAYEPMPSLSFHEHVCMLVRYVAYFEDGHAREQFLHAPMQLKFGRDLPLLHQIDRNELSDYVNSQAAILRKNGLNVKVNPLQYYRGESVLGFVFRDPLIQDKAA